MAEALHELSEPQALGWLQAWPDSLDRRWPSHDIKWLQSLHLSIRNYVAKCNVLMRDKGVCGLADCWFAMAMAAATPTAVVNHRGQGVGHSHAVHVIATAADVLRTTNSGGGHCLARRVDPA